MQIQPNPNAQRLDDHMVLVDCLEMEKHFCQVFTHAALEAATPEIRMAFEAGQREALEIAEELFRYAYSQGWYPVHPAPVEGLQRVATTFQEAGQGQARGYVAPWQQGPTQVPQAIPTYAGPSAYGQYPSPQQSTFAQR